MNLINKLQNHLHRFKEKFYGNHDLETVTKRLQSLQKKAGLYPLGHFYSPIPDLDEVMKDEAAIWGDLPRTINGIDLNEQEQLHLLGKFIEFYKEIPFSVKKTKQFRYFFENDAYSYSDAIILYSMIRYAKPVQVIEVGSGYSSCLLLDTNERFFDGKIKTTFIEPYPELFYSLIRESDKDRIRVIPARLQDIPLVEFDTLERNDILFIDSTHVSKVNSDVNCIFFRILPRLKSGVIIHFHDVFYPFEYPKSWVYEGRAWNEDYVLRTFLEYNSAFKILFFNTFMEYFFEDYFQKYMPLCLENKGGSIWLQKL
jgi:predicted O-methyltransferase YrrM